jgi:flagellar FliL protein
MAQEPAKTAPAEGEAPKKSKKKLFILIGAVLLVLAIVGAGVVFLLMSKQKAEHEGDEDVVQEAKKPKKKADAGAPPVFVNLDPFTVNLVPEQGDQYMQVALTLELEDAHADVQIKNQMPRIRNNLTMLLSSKKASELQGREGKEQLAKEIRAEINAIVDPESKGKPDAGPVLAVLFTSFIIQ